MSLIEFREPIESDIAHLIHLNLRFKHRFLADGETMPDDIQTLYDELFNLEALTEKYTLVFTVTHSDGFEQVIGSADFTDINHDLTAVAHFIMEPRFVAQFLREKVYLDVLMDRFRVLRVKKLLVVSEFFCTTAHRIAEAIGFKKAATLTDIVRYKKKVGDTYQYVVGDLHYFELTRKDLANAMQAHFIAEEIGMPTPQALPMAKKTRKRKEHSKCPPKSKIKKESATPSCALPTP